MGDRQGQMPTSIYSSSESDSSPLESSTAAQRLAFVNQTISGDENTGYNGFLRAGTLSLKLKSRLLELLDFAFLLGLTHRLVLLLWGWLGDSSRAFTLPHLLLDCGFNLGSILHDQAMDLPEGRSANEINVKLERAIFTDLIYIRLGQTAPNGELTSTSG